MATKLKVRQQINKRIRGEFNEWGHFPNVRIGDKTVGDDEKDDPTANDKEAIKKINALLQSNEYETKEDIKGKIAPLKETQLHYANDEDEERLAKRIFAELEFARFIKILKNNGYPSIVNKLENLNLTYEDELLESIGENGTKEIVNEHIKNITTATNENELNVVLQHILVAEFSNAINYNEIEHQPQPQPEVKSFKTKANVLKFINERMAYEFDEGGAFENVMIGKKDDIYKNDISDEEAKNLADSFNRMLWIYYSNALFENENNAAKLEMQKEMTELKPILQFKNAEDEEKLLQRFLLEKQLSNHAYTLTDSNHETLASKLIDAASHKDVVEAFSKMSFNEAVNRIENIINATSDDAFNQAINAIGIQQSVDLSQEHYAILTENKEHINSYVFICDLATDHQRNNLLKALQKENNISNVNDKLALKNPEEVATLFDDIRYADNKAALKDDLGIINSEDINAIFGEALFFQIRDAAKEEDKLLMDNKKDVITQRLGEQTSRNDVIPDLNNLDDLRKFMETYVEDKNQNKNIIKNNQPNPNRETAIGDGNCAFNAFVLGFSQPEVLDYLEKKLPADHSPLFNQFPDAAAKELSVTSNELKSKIIELRQTPEGKIELQKKLAPLMRKTAFDLAINDPEYFSSTAIENLKAALFDTYLKSIGVIIDASTKDDMFVHQSFKDKFAELIQHPILNATITPERYKELRNKKGSLESNEKEDFQKYEEAISNTLNTPLLDWWQKEGSDVFLQNMSQNKEWAGDLELSTLARFFNVSLEIISEGAKITAYTANEIEPSPVITVEHVNGNHYNNIKIEPKKPELNPVLTPLAKKDNNDKPQPGKAIPLTPPAVKKEEEKIETPKPITLTQALHELKEFMIMNTTANMITHRTEFKRLLDQLDNISKTDLSEDHVLRQKIINMNKNISPGTSYPVAAQSYKDLKNEMKTLDKFAAQFFDSKSQNHLIGSKDRTLTVAQLNTVTTLLLDHTYRLMGSEISRNDPENEEKIKQCMKDCMDQRDKLEIIKARKSIGTEAANLAAQIAALNKGIEALKEGKAYTQNRTYAQDTSTPKEITGVSKEEKMKEIIGFLTEGEPGSTTRQQPIDVDNIGTLATVTVPTLKEEPFVMENKEADKLMCGPLETYYVADDKIPDYENHCHTKNIPIDYDPETGKPIIKIRIGTVTLEDTHMGLVTYGAAIKFLDDKELQVMAARFVERTYNTLSDADKGKVMALSNKTNKEFAKAVIAYCRYSKAEHSEPRYQNIEPGKLKIEKNYEKAMKANFGDPETIRKRITGVENAILLKDQKPALTKEDLQPKRGWFGFN